MNYFHTKLLLQIFLDKQFNSFDIPLMTLWFFHCKCSFLQMSTGLEYDWLLGRYNSCPVMRLFIIQGPDTHQAEIIQDMKEVL